MLVCHTTWSRGALRLWAESARSWSDAHAPIAAANAHAPAHCFAADERALADLLRAAGIQEPTEFEFIELRLPSRSGRPAPSPRLAHAVGHSAEDDPAAGQRLSNFSVCAAAIPPARVCAVMDRLEDALHNGLADQHTAVAGASIEFFAAAVRMVRSLLAQQRFVPGVMQVGRRATRGVWQPWMADDRTSARVAALAASMPPIVRAVVDEADHNLWILLESFLTDVTDAQCRHVLDAEGFIESIESSDPAQDPHVRWLSGLLGPERATPPGPNGRDALPGRVRSWLAGLEDRGESSVWRLLFRLSEPESSDRIPDFQPPGDDVRWMLSFHLQACEAPDVVVDAADVWLFPTESVTIMGRRLDGPHDLLLGELGRASRLYSALEHSLTESQPEGLELTTRQAYHFLREVAPVLAEQGFEIVSPRWWDEPSVRLGAKMYIDSDPLVPTRPSAEPSSSSAGRTSFGIRSLVDYRWEITLGGASMTLEEFEQLASKGAPLLRIGGNWVEIRPEDVAAAVEFIHEHPGGKMGLREALSIAYTSDARATGIPVLGIEATGWVGAMLGGTDGYAKLPAIEQPDSFHGTLRPYQVRGLSWLWFLESLGFGPCLADDMGLGKTIQILALLAFEREEARRLQDAGASEAETAVGPTLLVVPMSVVGNWMHEAKRFCPDLKFMMHHGPDRLSGDAFVARAQRFDAIVTTYSLVCRDFETLDRVPWRRVVLDEAQFIKNPTTKQSRAVRELSSDSRVALTGTPVENRLSELWSIMDFLNPGYLGSSHMFRKRFSVPIERYRDQARAHKLRALIQPFVLRRLKSDPKVLIDLPEKIESREYTPLTREQASLYESCVNRLMSQVDRSDGIQRRGVVLAALVRLKQICNHPSQLLKDHKLDGAGIPSPTRSGKCVRLVELVREVLEGGDSSLIFTQFRQMGDILAAMLRHELDCEVLFLHGGTPQKERVRIVEQFQQADGSHPILIASLKAGGLGLNLTAATHVFHFDRWWNPAVENQATDRAYRIGQTRNVYVHKFVVSGTLEERIDEMIERKSLLADQIIGAGEEWLTEMDTDQLRQVLSLRRDAITAEG